MRFSLSNPTCQHSSGRRKWGSICLSAAEHFIQTDIKLRSSGDSAKYRRGRHLTRQRCRMNLLPERQSEPDGSQLDRVVSHRVVEAFHKRQPDLKEDREDLFYFVWILTTVRMNPREDNKESYSSELCLDLEEDLQHRVGRLALQLHQLVQLFGDLDPVHLQGETLICQLLPALQQRAGRGGRRVLTVKTLSGSPRARMLVSWMCLSTIQASSCFPIWRSSEGDHTHHQDPSSSVHSWLWFAFMFLSILIWLIHILIICRSLWFIFLKEIS